MVLKNNSAQFGRLKKDQLWGETSDQIGQYFTRFLKGSFSRSREIGGQNYPLLPEENCHSRDKFL